jgi:hypothetical protein
MTLIPVTSVLAQADTIPDNTGGAYVVAAYVVFVAIVVIYLAIMSGRLIRIARSADQLEARLDQLEGRAEPDATPLKAQPLQTTGLASPSTSDAETETEQVAS